MCSRYLVMFEDKAYLQAQRVNLQQIKQNINFGVQCNSGSDAPISTPYTVKANTNYKIFAEYDSNTLIAKLTVIGDLEGYSGSTYTMEASKSFVGFPTDITKVGLGSGSLGSGCVFYVGDGVGDGKEHIGKEHTRRSTLARITLARSLLARSTMARSKLVGSTH